MTLPAGVTEADVQVAVSSLHIAMSSFDKDVRVDELTLAEHDHLVRLVFAALAGRVVVPREPTPRMIEIGCDANPTTWNEGTDDGFAADVANDIYRAMIAAAVDGDA